MHTAILQAVTTQDILYLLEAANTSSLGDNLSMVAN